VIRRLALLCLLVLVTVPAAGAGRFELRGTVTRVVDGDTVDVRLAGERSERVRLIGIDSPERRECGYAAATLRTRTLALGRAVLLRGNRTQDTRDRHGRLLAYVWAGKRDVGETLVRGGFARVYVFERPFLRLGAYRRAEQVGRLSQQGLWKCGPQIPPPRR
jgi:micrococcal nuclease